MIALVVAVLVLGFLAWAIQTYAPIAAPFKQIAIFLLVLVVVYLVLQAFHLWPAGLPR